MRIRWTVPAAEDLESIKTYLHQHYPHVAEPTVRIIYQRVRSLKTLPRPGQTRPPQRYTRTCAYAASLRRGLRCEN